MNMTSQFINGDMQHISDYNVRILLAQKFKLI